MKDYTKDPNFWERLREFVKDVYVPDLESEEELEMILSVCKKKIEEVEG